MGRMLQLKKFQNVLVENTATKINWLNNTNSCEVFPETDISELKELIDYKPRYVLDDLKLLINAFKSKL